MRVPGRSSATTAGLIALAVLAQGWLAAGCARPTPIEVTWDRSEDLSRFRTWDWIDGHAVLVRAPVGDEVAVETQLTALVERSLRERGLSFAPGRGELRVAAMLVGVRTVETFRRARAMQTLYSHHDIGGYEVQSEDTERRSVDRCRVAIYLTGPRQERMIWQAMSEQHHEDGCARHLDDAVEELLGGFPPATAVEPAVPAS
jgi:Domain of unknown function (DUF4136)